jgi:hypothetical protein
MVIVSITMGDTATLSSLTVGWQEPLFLAKLWFSVGDSGSVG